VGREGGGERRVNSRVCACVQTNTYFVYVFETNSVYVGVYGCTCVCVCVCVCVCLRGCVRV